MCGIAGYLARPGSRPDRELLRAMCDRIAHRGPDADGYFTDDTAGLGHRRLSIIDVSGGAQPLGNEDGTIQIVFNGEIYNYREYREELAAKGHRFQTLSDTEVIVHLYEEVGERVPEYLNGMFAFALWDAPKRRLLLARDRMGKKPLYYAAGTGGARFAFASELKALAAMPGFDDAVDPESVADFLMLSYIPDPQSIYKSVSKLEAGHSLTVDDNGVRTRRYWTPKFEPDSSRKLDDAVEELRALAADAVERRMISEVPLGAFLSGGVDSSAVVAYMAQQAPDRVKTFSIGFREKKYDELGFARLVVDRYKTDHHERVVTPEIHEMFDVLVRHYDEPFADSSAIPTLYLSRMTREHVTVALSGDGADEIFGGYRLYGLGVVEERVRRKMPDWFRHSVVRLAGRSYPKLDFLPRMFRAKTTLINLSVDLADAHFNSRAAFRDAMLDRLLSPELKRQLRGYRPRDKQVAHFKEVAHLPPLEQMQAVDLKTYLPGDILVKTDRASMAYSLEARAPWLDYRIAELAGRLPASFKISGGIRKLVFKRAVAPHVPEELIRRPKMGFSVPMAEWMRSALKPVFESLVLRPDMGEYFDQAEARRFWSEHQSGLVNHDRRLWSMLVLAAWDEQRRSNRAFELNAILAG